MDERRNWERQKDISYREKRKGFKTEEEEMIEVQKSPESKAILFLPTEGQRCLFEASNAEKIYQGLFEMYFDFGSQITKSCQNCNINKS